MTVDHAAVIAAVERATGGQSIRKVAATLGVSKSLVDRFLRGERSIEPDQLYVALYRKYPELRWLLEEYQRRAAMADHVDAPEDDREETPVPAHRRA